MTINFSPISEVEYDVLVCHTLNGYSVAYVFNWNAQSKKYSRQDVKAIWNHVKTLAKKDYGYHNAIIGSGCVVDVSNDEIKPEHRAIADASYDLSYFKQHGC